MARLKPFAILLLLLTTAAWLINAYMVVKTKARIYSNISEIPPVQAVIVPGASVFRSGKLSPVLRQRMDGALKYLHEHKGVKLILSGHAIPHGYNETGPMLDYARKNSIPPEDILVDEKGRSTYVTLLNIHRNFQYRKLLIVSQEFHLPRALYIAQGMGMDSFGLVVAAEDDSIPVREYFVRLKDFILLRISRWFNANAD